MSTFNEGLLDLLARLPDAHKSGEGYRASCPVCGVNDALVIGVYDGRLKFACKADDACDADLVLEVLQRRNAAQADDESEGEEIKLLTVGEFLQEVGEPPAMLVDELLPDMSLVALAAKPKFAKSLLAVDILDSVCQGRPVCGTYKVNRSGSVIYFGMEDGRYEIANRLLKRGILGGDKRAFYVSPERLNLSRPGAIERLRALVAPIQPVLIVIDTAREGLGIKDWFNPAEVSDKVRPLRDFAREVCSVILIAHNRKAEGDGGDEIAGTNAFTSSIDGWLSCWKKEVLANKNLRLYVHKEGRGGLRGDCIVEMDTDTLHFKALNIEEVKEAAKQEQQREQEAERQERFRMVLRLMVETNEKANAQWIATQLEIPNVRTAQGLLQAMAARGWIEDSGERAGKTRCIIIYQLTEEGKREARKHEFTPRGETPSSRFGLDEEDGEIEI